MDRTDEAFATPDGVLEADASRPSSPTGSEGDWLERAVERDAASLAAATSTAVQEAEQLGRDAARGLEADLAREGDENDQGWGAKPDADPYEQQLEADLEDHLCKLRIMERNAPRERSALQPLLGAKAAARTAGAEGDVDKQSGFGQEAERGTFAPPNRPGCVDSGLLSDGGPAR
mmetsp:Transcript_46135/g.100215  ORF Transcript_46135/g.100215 Transcript_46135/m.100215 type:complete len:175 (+) Transcript_46135:86-610(+)